MSGQDLIQTARVASQEPPTVDKAEWTELDNADLGATGSITWTVACEEVPPPPVTYVSSVLNFSGTGWGGWSCGAGETIVSATWAGPQRRRC